VDYLDGNAIAGQLFEYYGREMTTVGGTCGHCGTHGQVAELRVYARAPGAVARCASCGSVVIVIVEVAGTARVTVTGFALELPSE
jgi:hypothetical protein